MKSMNLVPLFAMRMSLAFVAYLMVPTALANAPKQCPTLEIQSVSTSAKIDVTDGENLIQVESLDQTSSVPQPNGRVMKVTLVGPVYGSMDDHNFRHKILCTKDRIRLIVVVTRSAAYTGSVAKNILWQPQIEVVVVVRNPGAVVQAEWDMRLSNGKKLVRSRTPPFAWLTYPLVHKKVIQ